MYICKLGEMARTGRSGSTPDEYELREGSGRPSLRELLGAERSATLSELRGERRAGLLGGGRGAGAVG